MLERRRKPGLVRRSIRLALEQHQRMPPSVVEQANLVALANVKQNRRAKPRGQS